MNHVVASANMLGKWEQFNQIKWGCKTQIFQYNHPASNFSVESLFFLNKRNKFFLPPLTPYQPISFCPSSIDQTYQLTRQWHQAALLMVNEMIHYGGAAGFSLPCEINDIRPFLWNGLKAAIKYTYHIKLPYSIENASTDIRNRIKKGRAQGYFSALTTDMLEVYSCLLDTETRKGFCHHLNAGDLQLAQRIFGNDCFRCYVTYSKEGEPISTNIMLVYNKQAIWWIAGSKSDYLPHGVAPLSLFLALQDLGAKDIKKVDLVGANIPSIAKYKRHWGGELVPYYQVRVPVLKEILRSGLDWIKFERS